MRDSFDFIVIGGGTAGCVLAGRLLDLKAGTVAVVEQGSEPRGPRIYRPSGYLSLFGSRWDEACVTVPQPNLRGRKLPWPRGKMLGGSSGMNAMIYCRGNPDDYAAWPEAWSYASNLTAFRAIEERVFRVDSEETGEWQNRPSLHPLSLRFLAAAERTGPAKQNQSSLEATIGTCRFLRTQRHGRRLTAYDLFLRSHGSNEALTIVSEASIVSINFRDDRAVGVSGIRPDGRFELHAGQAVILCAGTVRSPTLLMRSGIGPTEELHRIGIEARIELDGVGRNLRDHLVYPIIHATPAGLSLEKPFRRESRLQYLQARDGPIASNLAEVGAFLKSADGHSKALDRPDVQLHFTPNHYLEYPVRARPREAWSIGVTLLHPDSCGSIGCDPESTGGVRIDPNYFHSRVDINRTLEAIRAAKRIAEQDELQSVSLEELLPGRNGMSDERLVASLQAYSTTIFHPIGTCAIGGGKEDGVVDAELRVRGTTNLFVADASVIPELPSSNPQAAVMMIGYRTAEKLSQLSSKNA